MSTSSEGPVVRFREVGKVYQDEGLRVTAVKSVTFDIPGQRFAMIVGPSGSGKSTLLATLSGLLSPDSGQVLALGQDLWGMTEKERERFRLRHVGFIFQGYNLFGALTARQQLEMVVRWGEGASAREARRRADEMLDLLGLAKKAHLLPAQMSGGEKQRVAIGRALIKDPRFCFADEPTSALDWKHGEQIIELLRVAAHERDAHQRAQAERLADVGPDVRVGRGVVAPVRQPRLEHPPRHALARGEGEVDGTGLSALVVLGEDHVPLAQQAGRPAGRALRPHDLPGDGWPEWVGIIGGILAVSGFVNFLGNGGTLQQVEALIAGSPEYRQNRGGGTTAGFLAALYNDFLGRSIDPSEEQSFEEMIAILSQGMQARNMTFHGFTSADWANELSLHIKASLSLFAAEASWEMKDSTRSRVASLRDWIQQKSAA